MPAQGVFGDGLVRGNERRDGFADDSRFPDCRELHQNGLDFRRIDVHAATVDDVFVTTTQDDMSAVKFCGQVAGIKPAFLIYRFLLSVAVDKTPGDARPLYRVHTGKRHSPGGVATVQDN